MKQLVAIHMVDLGVIDGKQTVHTPKSKFKAPSDKIEAYLLKVGAAREFNPKTDGLSQAEIDRAVIESQRVNSEAEAAAKAARENAKSDKGGADLNPNATQGGDPTAGKTRGELEALAEANELEIDGVGKNKSEYADAVRTALANKSNGEDLI